MIVTIKEKIAILAVELKEHAPNKFSLVGSIFITKSYSGRAKC